MGGAARLKAIFTLLCVKMLRKFSPGSQTKDLLAPPPPLTRSHSRPGDLNRVYLDNLQHLLPADVAVPVQVVHAEGPLQLLLQLPSRRHAQGDDELPEVYRAVAVGVKRSEDVLSELGGVTVGEEIGVDLLELLDVQGSARAVLQEALRRQRDQTSAKQNLHASRLKSFFIIKKDFLMLKMTKSLFKMPRLLMRRWFSGGKGHLSSAFVRLICSLKTFTTRGRDTQVCVPVTRPHVDAIRGDSDRSKPISTRRWSPSPYLVPLLQLVVGELGVLAQVLQHLWPQLAVLLAHVSGPDSRFPSRQQWRSPDCQVAFHTCRLGTERGQEVSNEGSRRGPRRGPGRRSPRW